MTEYSEYLIRQRARLNIGRRELAELLGVARDTVDKWETGQRKPTPLSRATVEMILKDAKPAKP